MSSSRATRCGASPSSTTAPAGATSASTPPIAAACTARTASARASACICRVWRGARSALRAEAAERSARVMPQCKPRTHAARARPQRNRQAPRRRLKAEPCNASMARRQAASSRASPSGSGRARPSFASPGGSRPTCGRPTGRTCRRPSSSRSRLMLVAKLVTVAMPFTFKWATDALVAAAGGAVPGDQTLAWLIGAPVLAIVLYGLTRIAMTPAGAGARGHVRQGRHARRAQAGAQHLRAHAPPVAALPSGAQDRRPHPRARARPHSASRTSRA